MRNNDAIEPPSTRDEQGHQRTVSCRENRVSWNREVLIINKNQLCYSNLSANVKQLFTFSLRQIYERKAMKEIFHRWQDPLQNPIDGKQIQIGDRYALDLVWRMQKLLQRYRNTDLIIQIKKQISILQQQYNSFSKTLRTINQCKSEKNRIKNTNKKVFNKKCDLSQQMFLASKIKDEKKKQIDAKISQKKQVLERLNEQIILYDDMPLFGSLLHKTINKKVIQLLNDSIIFIVEISRKVVIGRQAEQEEVYVVFESCYATKKIKKMAIVMIIGSYFYDQKVKKFNQFVKSRRKLSPRQQFETRDLMCCHRCMKVCQRSSLKLCDTKIESTHTKSYTSTDYYTYRKLNLEGDYFYNGEEKHVLPFFQYNKDTQSKLSCNRSFCNDCISLLRKFVDKQWSCDYCQGYCCCQRCEKASGIVKLIALNYKNDPQEKCKYHKVMKLFRNTHPSVSENFDLRIPGFNHELDFLLNVWDNCNEQSIRLRMECDPKKTQVQNVDKVQEEIVPFLSMIQQEQEELIVPEENNRIKNEMENQQLDKVQDKEQMFRIHVNKISNKMELEFNFAELLHGFNSSLQQIN